MPTTPPTVIALLAAEGIHQDAMGKAYILGVCHAIRFERFPAVLPRSVIYVALTDGHGSMKISVRLVDATDDDAPPLFAFEFTAEFRSPLDVREVAVTPPPSLTIPKAGLYRWQVVCNGEVIGERRLVVEAVG